MPYQRWVNRTLRCQECRKLFDASRFDAVYCSAKCRNAHKRRVARVDLLKTKILESIEELGKYEGQDGEGQAIKALQEIETRARGLKLLLADE